MGLMQQFRQPSSLSAILAMTNGNPQALMSRLRQENPQFEQFVQQNKDKTPEQAFREHGFDYNQFRNLM